MEAEILVPSRHIRLKIRGSGKAPPKKYGPNVFKVSFQEAYLLKSRGWSIVARTRGSVFVRHEKPDQGGLPTIIDVDVPTAEQVIELAKQLFQAGGKWSGTVGEWFAYYSPAKQAEVKEIDVFTKQEGGTTFAAIEPHLQIGSLSLWDSSVYWQGGHPTHHENKANVVEEVIEPSGLLAKELMPNTFREGAAEQVLVNRYERDREARRICIEHFGPVCAACGLDFCQRYGELASGFIHVHHKVPLSEIGVEYAVNPINDLVPVCPNCHAVIHLTDPPCSVEQVREMLDEAKVG